MAYKFKVGDLVEIVRDDIEPFPPDFKKGDKGKIVKIIKNMEFPYRTRCNGKNITSFCAKELKLIKRKEN